MEQYKDIQDILNDFSFLLWPCCVDCWILVPHQGMNLCPLHWKHGVLPLDYQGSPWYVIFFPKNIPSHCLSRVYKRLVVSTLSNDVCMCVLVTQSCKLFVTPWGVALQASLSMGFSRQEWVGVGCHALLQGTLPYPGTGTAESSSALQADCLPSEPPGKPPEQWCPRLIPSRGLSPRTLEDSGCLIEFSFWNLGFYWKIIFFFLADCTNYKEPRSCTCSHWLRFIFKNRTCT